MKPWTSILGTAIRHALCVLALGLPALLHAQVLLYGVDTSTTLYSINPLTQTATAIGSTGFFMEGLALSPTGQLYSTDGAGNLYSINTATGVATSIGSTGQGNIESLTFVGSTLLGLSFNSSPTLFSIDTSTAAITDIAAIGTLTGVPRAMTMFDGNTVLVTADNDGASASLYSVDVNTGAMTAIGPIAISGQFAAMTLASNGVLYGFDNVGQEWQIDQSTGAITLLGNTGSQFWLDTTTQAIPEPTTWTLLISGATALLVGAARRRWV